MAEILRHRRRSAKLTAISQGQTKSPEEILLEAEKNNIKVHPLDMKALYRYYGIKIYHVTENMEYSGTLENRNEGWVVYINSLHHPRRQLFTLAHELGHFFLHRNQKDKFVDKSYFTRESTSKNTLEREADEFAAELLMPMKIFREQIEKGRNKISELADYFGTSMYAVKVRAQRHGYL